MARSAGLFLQNFSAVMSGPGIVVRLQNKRSEKAAHALRHPLLPRRGRRRLLDQGAGRRRHGEARRRAGQARQAGPARPGGAAAADHGGDDAAQGASRRWCIDGPFAETKEQLLGFYIVDCENLDEALDVARDLGAANPGGAYEIRPVGLFRAREASRDVTDIAWIDAALTSARPQAVGALLRYFRDLDTAEEAFQDACLRALKTWPQNGPPRDPAAWLIMVGRNVAIDEVRRSRKQAAAAGGRGDLRSRRRRGASSPSGSTARITATTSCGCCSSAAIPTCRRRSRSRWRCASSPA